MDYVTTSADIAGIACDLLAIGVRQGQLDAALSVFEPALARDLAAAAAGPGRPGGRLGGRGPTGRGGGRQRGADAWGRATGAGAG
jgi:hypothetical protein